MNWSYITFFYACVLFIGTQESENIPDPLLCFVEPDTDPGKEDGYAQLVPIIEPVQLVISLDKLVNLDRLQYNCTRPRSLEERCKI